MLAAVVGFFFGFSEPVSGGLDLGVVNTAACVGWIEFVFDAVVRSSCGSRKTEDEVVMAFRPDEFALEAES
jgi:hypothetical protein